MENDLFRCSACKRGKPRGDFYERKPTDDDSRPVMYECRSCRGERDRSGEVWNRAFRRHRAVCMTCNWPKKLATTTECADCLAERGLRVCSKCGELRLLFVDFYEKSNGVPCLSCLAEMYPEHEVSLEGIKKRRTRLQNVRDLPPEVRDRARAVQKYGLTWDTYVAMLEAQKNCCAICKDDISKRAHIDHDHVTGKVRGLLCVRCNLGLGMFRDNDGSLEAAITYLREARTSPGEPTASATPSEPAPGAA